MQNGRNSYFEELVTMNLTLARLILQTVMHLLGRLAEAVSSPENYNVHTYRNRNKVI